MWPEEGLFARSPHDNGACAIPALESSRCEKLSSHLFPSAFAESLGSFSKEDKPQKRWRENEGLMEFLRKL